MPTTLPDVPICAILITLYLLLAVLHARIFLKARKQSSTHLFFMWQAALIPFSMARVTTYVLRIVWSQYPYNSNLAIAAQIFSLAGIIIIVVLNIHFSVLVLWRLRPELQHVKPLYIALVAVRSVVLPVLIVGECSPFFPLVPANDILAIVGGVQLQLTGDPNARSTDIILTKFAGTFNVVLATFPLLFLALIACLYHSQLTSESLHVRRIGVTIVSTLLVLFIMVIRLVVSYKPMTSDPWIVSKAAYYFFGPFFEILTSLFLAFVGLHELFGVLPANKTEQYSAANGMSTVKEASRNASIFDNNTNGTDHV